MIAAHRYNYQQLRCASAGASVFPCWVCSTHLGQQVVGLQLRPCSSAAGLAHQVVKTCSTQQQHKQWAFIHSVESHDGCHDNRQHNEYCSSSISLHEPH